MKTIKELLIEKQTEKFIRKKYSLNDELKMARKSHEDNEWITYNAYVEECITKAKEYVIKTEEARKSKINLPPLMFNKFLKKESPESENK